MPIDLTVYKVKDEENRLRISAINIHGKNITTTALDPDYPTRLVSKEEFLAQLSKEVLAPVNRITLNPSLTDEKLIFTPYSYHTGRFTIDFFKETEDLKTRDSAIFDFGTL